MENSGVIYEYGYVVSTYAGTGKKGCRDGAKGEAQFNCPTSVAVDKNGDIYVADSDNRRLCKITADDGTVHTVAGTGIEGFKDAPARETQFKFLHDIAIGDNGDVIILDGNIRAFSPTEKTVRTIAGHLAGSTRGVAVAADGNVLACARGTHSVVKIRGDSVEIVAGCGQPGYADGTARYAKFRHPQGIAVGSRGDIYVADIDNHRLRKIDVNTREVTTVAGTGAKGWHDGNASVAQFSCPSDIAIGADGFLYISDRGNYCVRRFDPVSGRVVTLAGTGKYGFCDGDGSKAQFGVPCGLTLGPDRVLYVVDGFNHCIRAIAKHPEAKLSIVKHPEAKLSNPETYVMVSSRELDDLHGKLTALEEREKEHVDRQICKICFDQPRQGAFLPCGHFACCLGCANGVAKCPICSAIIHDFHRVFEA